MKGRIVARAIVLASLALVWCGPFVLSAAGADPVAVAFWTLPDPEPAAFWTEMAERYMAENPDVQLNVSAIVEAPTSEAVLLTAIAGGTPPAAAGGTFAGFAAQLADEGAIVALDTLPGWEDVIVARHMEEAIKAWQFPDGHCYVLPIFSNPMLFSWRLDVLKELGFGEAPRTYSGVTAVAEKLKELYPEKYLKAYKRLGSASWYYRWYDFFPLYNAASNGQPFLSGNVLTADEEAAIEVFQFFADLADGGHLLPQNVPDAFPTAFSIWRPCGPWELPRWAETFPELTYGDTFVVTPPPAPDDFGAVRTPMTFSDAKGYVILADASEAQRAAAWEFLTWVLSDAENDLRWAEVTGMLPVRDDLGTNPAFGAFFAEHPELVAYAEEIPYSVPALMHAKYADIYTAIGELGLVPVVMGEKTGEQAWQDVKAAIAAILEQ